MALTVEALGQTFPRRRFTYDETDTILYALGVGAGTDDPAADLPFVYERCLRALPSQATVIAWDDSWIPALGLDEQRIVHGEQRVTLHRPLPVAAAIEAEARIVDLVDKGPGRGALIYVETRIEDAAGPLATLLSTVFARGDGGFGGAPTGGLPRRAVPDRAPDLIVAASVPPGQAFVYRLSGDRNPLHVDPEFARSAGFERPILHGLSTYGVAVRCIVAAVLDRDPAAVEHVAARFAAPLVAGGTVRVPVWRDGRDVAFRLLDSDDRIVLDDGLLQLRG